MGPEIAYNVSDSLATEAEPDIVVKGGTLTPVIDRNSRVSHASVFVRNERIVDIRTSCDRSHRPAGAEVTKVENCLTMPGLINSHSHTATTLFRGYAQELPQRRWLFEKILPAE